MYVCMMYFEVCCVSLQNTEGGAAKSPEPLWLAKYIASLNSCLDKLRKSCDIIEAKTALEILKTITKLVYMTNLTHHLICYINFRVKAYRKINLVRALDEDTRVFSFLFCYSPLGQTAVSEKAILRIFVLLTFYESSACLLM